jgi:hypothetical protein
MASSSNGMTEALTTSHRLQGSVACTQYGMSGNAWRDENKQNGLWNQTLYFYQRLWSTTFAGTLPMSMANYDYAYDLYDFAAYHYNHNKTIRATLQPEELKMLGMLADNQQFSLNGNLSASGLQQGDRIRAIAGRTLAQKMVDQLQMHIATGGRTNKLSLLFGSFEPMLAFFALSGLSNGPSGTVFQSIPAPGSAMVVELFSIGSDTSSFPSTNDLWVRFMFRNGTESQMPFREYSLFNLGNSRSQIKWDEFTRNIAQFSIYDVPSWCNACGSSTVFCMALGNSMGGGSPSVSIGQATSSRISPPIAGLIGAVVALAVTGLIAAAVVLLFGFRIHRKEAGPKGNLGGFKGPEKMQADNDVVVTKTGARHERTGSWELGGPGAAPKPVDLKEETTFGATVIRRDDDDNDSIMGIAPVNPRESV